MKDFTQISGALFDIDGTLFDSNDAWDIVTPELLRNWGYEPKPTLAEDIFPLGTLDIAPFLKADYNMKESVESILEYIADGLHRYYINTAPTKPGVVELLHFLHERGVKMAVVTASVRRAVLSGLENKGLLDMFDAIFTCDDIGYTKHEPQIFIAAQEKLGVPAESIWLFDDAPYALGVARSLGMTSCGISDPANEYQRDMLVKNSDFFLETFDQWVNLPFAAKPQK